MTWRAVLDANVLYCLPVRHLLLNAYEAEIFQAFWTSDILNEVFTTLERERPDLTPEQRTRAIELMLFPFPEALVEDYRPLMPQMRNDVGDRHVLAAAVTAGADVVTWNLRHFPREACEPYGVEIFTPDDFLSALWHEDPEQMARALHQQASDRNRSLLQTLDTLARHIPHFVEIARISGLL